MATLYNSPPERFYTSLSKSDSMFNGISTSVLKIEEFQLSFSLVNNNSYTVPTNFGAIVYGL